ncbi:hypothetical protein LTR66_001904 [Elasticomyces elasticus]|nr:hypothetical protein LTR66_001904 [Elasticomyces elasticus]
MSSIELATRDGLSEHYNDWPNDIGFEADTECRTVVELTVRGSIPSYCAGTLYRTGPGKYKVESQDGKTINTSHWFDGLAQVHRFRVLPPSDSNFTTRVLYNSRFTVDTLVENIRKTGNMSSFTFGQKRDPCQSFFGKVMGIFAPVLGLDKGKPDSHNINVSLSVNLPGLQPPMAATSPDDVESSGIASLVNKTDANGYQFLDPTTLEPIGLSSQAALHPDLKGPMCATHSRTDPLTGDWFNYNLDISSTSTYRVFRVSASNQKTTILATITSAPPAYLHSIFLTQNYVILCVWGSHFAMYGLKILYTRNVLDALNPIDPTQPCRWYVVDRSSQQKGLVAVYTSPAFFAFHAINAYEEASPTRPGETDIVADLPCYDDLSILKRFYYENLMSSSPDARKFTGVKGESTRSWLGRYRLPNIPAEADHTTFAGQDREAVREWATARSQSVELPTINPRFITLKHRYIYGITDRGNSTFFDGLAKFDCLTQTALFWSEKGQSAGEATFVPDPDAREEDEDAGVLLTVVLDGYKEKSYLLVLDARTMKEVGRAEMDRAAAFSYHGVHVPSQGPHKGKALDC